MILITFALLWLDHRMVRTCYWAKCVTSYGTSGPNEFEFETGYLSPVVSVRNQCFVKPFKSFTASIYETGDKRGLLYKAYSKITSFNNLI